MQDTPLSIAFVSEIAMRGGAAGICLLIGGLLLSIRPLRAVTLLGALFAAGAADYAVVSIPQVAAALGDFFVPVKLLAMVSPAFFWLFIIALFDDDFEWRPWMAPPPLALGLLFLSCTPFPALQPYSKTLHVLIVLALMGHVARLTRLNLCDDLVMARRQFTRIIAVLVPLVCLAIGIIEIYELFELNGPFASLTVAALLLLTTAAFGFGVAGIRRSLLPVPAEPARRKATGNPAADRFDLARLEELMMDGVYLNTGLTIGDLANRMNIPEHRLRRLINKGLGYRNFAAFINDHRIAEARRRLSEPETARDQITSLAFDLGYSSLAPFNRAFRERLGMSPSQFREKALEGA